VAVLFGDAAAAVVVSSTGDPNRGILYTTLHADGKGARALCLDIWDISKKPYITQKTLESRDIWPAMEGRTVFKHAVTRLSDVMEHTLACQGLSHEQIKYVIPHQANMRINQFVAAKMGIPEEKFLHNMQRYGNTTAASIPLLLDETSRAGKLDPGDLLLLVGFGAGFTWGATLLRW